MADLEAETPEDPWLTLAEIAEELRMSPATIRSWVSNGTLRAMRPGKRKLLVRRSELDRMLAGEDLYDPDAPEVSRPAGEARRHMDTIVPPGKSPHWSAEAVEHVSRSGWLGVAETEWRRALRSSAMAPPDPGFIVRIKDIAEAAARKAAALDELGEHEPGAWWQRQSGLPGGALSYELRPGGNRPGPAELWVRFDRAVDELGRTMAEHSVLDERQALEEVSLVLHDIVDALLEQEGRQWPPPPDEPDHSDRDTAEEPDDA
ncbi:MAG TPA: helix-turn-helix domain-containing protein [Solirubrobacteraceae bacterium]|nr:helix-turn-helix domain-containing protein [Solirubrobacteraceae bacterium]